ncbi:hypothetical protein BHE74_00022588 [Ensete ventricosum]|nr:hypothetical protein GW17_00049831 [Ensete ventricosum]RWW69774.1 hypothetical protein BHE74_00022588 [Ensete ventricosum]
MGGIVPHHLGYPRGDLYPSNNGRRNPPSDLAHIKLEEILCLAIDEELRMNWISSND